MFTCTKLIALYSCFVIFDLTLRHSVVFVKHLAVVWFDVECHVLIFRCLPDSPKPNLPKLGFRVRVRSGFRVSVKG